ncbi:MAG: transporter, family, cyanate transporter [Micromonosporaceae bacterium]|nr:transporter, family, cyanate transporter [Micromonosporaceae bacterium]
MTGSAAPAVAVRAVRPATVLVGVLLLAVNLRAALAAYPPLLAGVRTQLGLSAGTAGLVQASAVMLMGVGSLSAPRLAGRLGWERALGLGVAVVAAGSLVRLVPAPAALVTGSVLVGGGIGVAGVLVAGVVKHHLGARAATVTGAYVVAMMVGATVASAVAVPLAIGLGGWSRSLAVWSVPAALAVLVWWPVARRFPPGRAGEAAPDGSAEAPDRSAEAPGQAGPAKNKLPWRNGFARLAATYMAMSSVQFYGWLTWLSPYYQSLGWPPQRAALLQALWSIVQIPAALVFTAAAERRLRWTFWAALSLACGVAGTAGALCWPVPPVVGPWLWVSLMAVGVGAGFPLGLSVIAWRASDGAAAGAVSGVALGVGYFTAGVVPLVMGVLLDLTGGYPVPLGLLLVAGVVQAVAIVLVGNGRDRGRPAPGAGAGG